jgi:hypothetical protein
MSISSSIMDFYENNICMFTSLIVLETCHEYMTGWKMGGRDGKVRCIIKSLNCLTHKCTNSPTFAAHLHSQTPRNTTNIE